MFSMKEEFEEEPVDILDLLEIPNGEEQPLHDAEQLLNEDKTTQNESASATLVNETLSSAASKEEFEQELLQWIHQSESFGCRLTREHVTKATHLLSDHLTLDFHVGSTWVQQFIKRKNIRFSRTKVKLSDWFKAVEQGLDEIGLVSIMDDPSRVWRCDQALFNIKKNGNFVVNYRTSDRLTKRALFLFSASGKSLKPHLIDKGEPKRLEIAGVTAANTEDGIVTHEEFARYLAEDFAPQLRLLGVQFPIVLFLCPETLHDHIGVWQTARQLGIILVTLHPDVVRADKRLLKTLDSTWSELHHKSNPNRSIEPLAYVLDQLRGIRLTESAIKQSFKEQRLFQWFQNCSRTEGRPQNISRELLEEECIVEVNIEEPVTYQCRACRREGDEDFVSMEEEGLATLFKDLTGIVVDEDSSSFACMKCKIQLESFADFRRVCLSSQKAFEAEKEGKDQSKPNEPRKEVVMEFSIGAKVDEKENPNYSTTKMFNVFAKKSPKVRSRVRPKVQHEYKDEKVTCNECKQILERRFFLKHWLYEHCIDEEPSLCSECGKTLPSVYKLEKHLRKDHGILKCINCDRVDSLGGTRTALRNHKQHMNKCTRFKDSYNYECKPCGKKFLTKYFMEQHRFLCTGTKTIVCEFCGITVKIGSYTLHKNKHITKTYVCRYCPKTFQSYVPRTLHENKVHNPTVKPFHCALCPMKFRMKHNLKNHIIFYHIQRKNRKKTCQICGATVQNLRQHMNQHTDYRPYPCEVAGCGAKFRSQGSLIKHNYAHSKTRPYNCTLCTTGYYHTSYLRDHYKRTHGIVYAKGQYMPIRKGEINLPTVQETDEVQGSLQMDENCH